MPSRQVSSGYEETLKTTVSNIAIIISHLILRKSMKNSTFSEQPLGKVCSCTIDDSSPFQNLGLTI